MEYDTVYEAWLREKKAEELQPIPKDFYKQLAEYIHTLREKVAELGGETVEGEIAEEELKNVYEMARSLVKLRLRKILRRAMRGETINAESITPEESKFLEGAKHLSEIYHNILGMVSGRLETGALKEAERGVEEKPKKILVRFLRDIPAIVGADMRPYGPFRREDVAALPPENAKALIGRGAAVEVKADEDTKGH
mgnify:CR=1 FL=1